MNFRSINLLLFVLILGNFDKVISNDNKDITRKYFEEWQLKYNTFFPNEHEKEIAYQNFETNFKRMMLQKLKYFKGDTKFLIEMNARACHEDKRSWTGAKFSEDEQKFLSNRALKKSRTLIKPPDTLDYRKLGMVTPVEDQGFTCSSCYAFASACGIEGQIAKKYGKLIPLSSQMFVDCSSVCGNLGCEGGFIAQAYGYIAKNQGIANSTAYPYTGDIQNCQYTKTLFSANITSYEFVTGDENYLKSVLAEVGPLPVGMRGSLDSFYYYSSGIYDDSACDGTLDHAVCLVGYGSDNSTSPPTDYWIVKNSWSTDWGENGYFRLKMGSNVCGIRNYVVYPVI